MLSKIQQALHQYRRKKHGEFGLGYIVSQKQLNQLKNKGLGETSVTTTHSSGYDVKMHGDLGLSGLQEYKWIERDQSGSDLIAKAHH